MKAAVIGLGRIGFLYSLDEKRKQPASHVACYNALPEIDAIAVCDSDTDKLAPALATIDKTKKAYSNYHEMMREFQPDVVSIATPTPTHLEIACRVAAYPSVKTIFLEKPLAQSIKEARKILKACKKNRVRLAVNYTRRWSLTYQAVKRMFGFGRFGAIFQVIGVYSGPLLRTGSHMIDVFNFFVGEQPIWVQAFGRPESNYLTLDNKSNDFNISGIISYADVDAILISGKQKPYLTFEVDIFAEKGRIRITRNGSFIRGFESFSSERYENIRELKPVLMKRKIDRESVLLRAVREVVGNAAVPKDSKIQKALSCSGEKAFETLVTALALHKSSAHVNEMTSVDLVPENYTVRSY
mgnify:CR=1 FL=1